MVSVFESPDFALDFFGDDGLLNPAGLVGGLDGWAEVAEEDFSGATGPTIGEV